MRATIGIIWATIVFAVAFLGTNVLALMLRLSAPLQTLVLCVVPPVFAVIAYRDVTRGKPASSAFLVWSLLLIVAVALGVKFLFLSA